jgi:hypothetical protein
VPRGVATAKQLAMMARVLETYCERFGVPSSDAVRDELGLEILTLFDRGFRDEETLLAELIRRQSQFPNADA